VRRGDDTLDDDLGLAWEEEPSPGDVKTRQFRRQRRENRGRKGRSSFAVMVSAGLLAVLGLGVFVGLDAIKNLEGMREFLSADYEAGEMGDEVRITVESGDGGEVIANRLRDADVIKSVNAFLNVCQSREQDCLAIQPGTYVVRKHSPAAVVFGVLIDPANRVPLDGARRITIREGLTVIQTLAKLAEETGIPLEQFQAAAADPASLGITPDWYARGDGKPSAVAERNSIEGFLFPSTYEYSPDWSAHDILTMMVDQFFVVAERVDVRGRADFLGISPYEVLITASLVQSEGLEHDFAKIARVAYNRIYKDRISCQCLQFDSTAHYWLELQSGAPRTPTGLTPGQLNDPNNPYNTYDKTPGMPLGPISNPGEAALQAAANPEDGDWVFFVVVEPDGTTAFAVTHEEHCANVALGIANGVDLSPIC
jgi:UPF0755 protein